MSGLESVGERSRFLVPKPDRQQQRADQELAWRTRSDARKVDAKAALTAHIMERVVDIDDYRRALARGDETLNAILLRFELGFIAGAERTQRSSGSESGL